MSEIGTENVDDVPKPDPVARLAFVLHVYSLIQRGFNRIGRLGLHASEEEDITGLLTEAIEGILEGSGAPGWAEHIEIHEEKRKSDGNRLGKKRLRLDFEFVRTGRGRRPRFVLEAKRLGPDHHIGGEKGYLGPKGMGAFLAGEYAAEHGDAGMLGYMQSQTAEHWRNQLATALHDSSSEYAVESDGGWGESFEVDSALIVHRTIHGRDVGRSPITIYHTLLDFRAA
jgi:hypothetical protein